MYILAIRKCTSPPLLDPRLKIFKWKFTTPPGIEPRTCWTRGRHATIWASAASFNVQCQRVSFQRPRPYKQWIPVDITILPDLWSGQKPWWNWYLTLVANFGKIRRAQLAKSTLSTSTLGPLGDILRSVQMKKREWGTESKGKLPHVFNSL